MPACTPNAVRASNVNPGVCHSSLQPLEGPHALLFIRSSSAYSESSTSASEGLCFTLSSLPHSLGTPELPHQPPAGLLFQWLCPARPLLMPSETWCAGSSDPITLLPNWAALSLPFQSPGCHPSLGLLSLVSPTQSCPFLLSLLCPTHLSLVPYYPVRVQITLSDSCARVSCPGLRLLH